MIHYNVIPHLDILPYSHTQGAQVTLHHSSHTLYPETIRIHHSAVGTQQQLGSNTTNHYTVLQDFDIVTYNQERALSTCPITLIVPFVRRRDESTTMR